MPHLILTDDNLTTQKVFQLAFPEEDVEVTCFGRGSDTLSHLAEHAADLVVINVSLPDIDGYELCRRVRALPAAGDLPVLLLVGAFQSFDEKRAREAGCQDHLTKPFETSTLVSKVRQLLATVPLPSASSRTARASKPPGVVFEIPVGRAAGETLFELSRDESAATPVKLERELVKVNTSAPVSAPDPTPAPEAVRESTSTPETDLELLVQMLLERLPSELPKILPDLVRDLKKPPSD